MDLDTLKGAIDGQLNALRQEFTRGRGGNYNGTERKCFECGGMSYFRRECTVYIKCKEKEEKEKAGKGQTQ